jgi:hypothetical protein
MQPGGAVALDYEAMLLAFFNFRRRLRSFLKAPLTFVLFEGHQKILNWRRSRAL